MAVTAGRGTTSRKEKIDKVTRQKAHKKIFSMHVDGDVLLSSGAAINQKNS
jgi:hypothetical protein